MTLRVQRLTSTAKLPVRGSKEAAGYDLSADLYTHCGAPHADAEACSDGKPFFVIAPGERKLVPTGLALTVPEGTYGRIGPRSGLALKNGIDTLAGIVDRDYTSEVGVILINLGQTAFVIEHGMRIAQLVLERIATPDVVEVDSLGETTRGAGGFGSTGL